MNVPESPVLRIVLGIAALWICYWLGNAERREIKLHPVVYWFTWLFGGVAGVSFVGSEIGGTAGAVVGLSLGCAYALLIGKSLRSDSAVEC